MKTFFAALIFLAAALTCGAQKISNMILTNTVPDGTRIETSTPIGGGWVTRSIELKKRVVLSDGGHATNLTAQLISGNGGGLSNAVALTEGDNITISSPDNGRTFEISATGNAALWGTGDGKIFATPSAIIHGNGGGLSNAVAFTEGDNITITSPDNGRTWTISSTGGGGDIDTNLWILRDEGHGTNTTIWSYDGPDPVVVAQVGLGYYYDPQGNLIADFPQNELFSREGGTDSTLSIDWDYRRLVNPGADMLFWDDTRIRIPSLANGVPYDINFVVVDLDGKLYRWSESGGVGAVRFAGVDTNQFTMTNGLQLAVRDNGVGSVVQSNVISSVGDDTHVDLNIRPQGYGQIVAGPGGWAYNTQDSAAGSLLFNNGLSDTPGIKFVYDDNVNFALDSANGELRFIHNADEAGGAVIASLDSSGNLSIAGKFDATGGVDPPYLLLDENTRAEVKGRVSVEVKESKKSGAALFWNKDNKRLEIFVSSEDKFFDILGNEINTGGTVTGVAPPPFKGLGETNTVTK